MGGTTARLRSKGGNLGSGGGGTAVDEKTKRRLSGEDLSLSVSASTAGQQLELMSNNESSFSFSSSSSSSSSGRNYIIRRRRVVCFIRFTAVLLVVVVGLISAKRNNNNNIGEKDTITKLVVPPLRGQAYLSPEEFLDVRESRDNESVLVTGGLGFIGSHVVDLLLHRGFHVTILDDESNGHNHNEAAKELVPRDVSVMSDLPSYYPKMKNANRNEDVETRTTTPLEVSTTDRSNSNSSNNHHRDMTEQEGSGGNTNYFTHVIHLAAAISVSESMSNPEKYERINYEGSQNLLDWIRGYNTYISTIPSSSSSSSSFSHPTTIRRIVAASSAAIYGDPNPDLLPLQESAPYGGLSPYADTKYRMEGLMRDFVTRQNEERVGLGSSLARTATTTSSSLDAPQPQTAASAVALRFFNVYGPRQDPKNPYSGVISLFLDMAVTGRDITILGDGEMTRDFVYVKDVARAIVLALLQEDNNDEEVSIINREERERQSEDDDDEATFNVYNVCTGKSITINSLAERVRQSMKSTSKIKHLDPREGDIRESSCDPTGAEDGIGFRSAVSQESGLEKTASWFRLEQQQASQY